MPKKSLVFTLLLLFNYLFVNCTSTQTLSKPEFVIKDAHKHSLRVLAFSPNGKILAAGSFDGIIKFWNTSNWKVIKKIKTDQAINGLSFSPNGKLLASNGYNTPKVILWDVKSGKKVKTWKAYSEGGSYHSRFSTDGKYFVTVDKDRIKFWSTKTYKMVKNFRGKFFSFSLDSRKFVYITPIVRPGISPPLPYMPTKIVYLDLKSGKVLDNFLKGYKLDHFTLSPDGKYIAFQTWSNSIIYNIQNKETIKIFSGARIYSLPVFYNNDIIIFNKNNKLVLFNFKKSARIQEFDLKPIYIENIALSPKCRLIATLDSKFGLRVWRIKK